MQVQESRSPWAIAVPASFASVFVGEGCTRALSEAEARYVSPEGEVTDLSALRAALGEVCKRFGIEGFRIAVPGDAELS